MAKLILSLDGIVLKEQELTKERTTIGRKPHNDVQIDNLAVSGEHAVIVTILNDSFLEDMGSTNGTMVNGNSVKKHFLQNSDVVEIGKYKLKYINEVASSTTASDFEKTMVLRAPMATGRSTPGSKSLSDTQIGGHGARTQGVATVTSLNRMAPNVTQNPVPAMHATGTAGLAYGAPTGAKAAASQAGAGAETAMAARGGSIAAHAPLPMTAVPQVEAARMPLGAIQILTGPALDVNWNCPNHLLPWVSPGYRLRLSHAVRRATTSPMSRVAITRSLTASHWILRRTPSMTTTSLSWQASKWSSSSSPRRSRPASGSSPACFSFKNLSWCA